jgi:radical SAM protein (TIGR01212 family)
MRYNNLSGYFRRKYSRRIKKICIDGGFSCPNRDGKCGTGGCIYCGERGAGEHIDPLVGITEQVQREFSRGSDDDIFLVYFQNFTNTYADVDTLRERYDAALIDQRIKLMSIGTRPDCIDEEIAELISSYKDRVEVWVELGLQTASDETARIINRGYGRETFECAMKILEKYDIPVVVHLIVGLPGETLDHIKETCRYLAKFKIFGVKIHSIYVMEGTRLAEMYRAGKYTPPTLDEYSEGAAYIISHLHPDIVLHRITGDCPRELLIAPDWNVNKDGIIAAINKKLEEKGLSQGDLFSEN